MPKHLIHILTDGGQIRAATYSLESADAWFDQGDAFDYVTLSPDDKARTVAKKAASNLLLTIHEAAAALKTTVSQIRTLIRQGDLPHVRLGQRFLIDVKDLDAFIQKKKENRH